MQIWVLDHFVLGAGTFTLGIWDDIPSGRQIMRATDLPMSYAVDILNGESGDYSLEEKTLDKGEYAKGDDDE